MKLDLQPIMAAISLKEPILKALQASGHDSARFWRVQFESRG
jgi:hypothetical protein